EQEMPGAIDQVAVLAEGKIVVLRSEGLAEDGVADGGQTFLFTNEENFARRVMIDGFGTGLNEFVVIPRHREPRLMRAEIAGQVERRNSRKLPQPRCRCQCLNQPHLDASSTRPDGKLVPD